MVGTIDKYSLFEGGIFPKSYYGRAAKVPKCAGIEPRNPGLVKKFDPEKERLYEERED